MYFKNFPDTLTVVNDNISRVKNIIRQVAFSSESLERDSSFSQYQLGDSDTLESLALKVYGQEDLSWIIMLYNEVLDPSYDLSVDSVSIQSYIDKKYEGQSLFLSAVGSSLPYQGATFSPGDLVIRKISEGELDKEKYAFVKSYNPEFGQLQLEKQAGGFAVNDEVSIFSNNVELSTANIIRVVEDGRFALHHFGTGPAGEYFNALGTPPDSNGDQTSIGFTQGVADFVKFDDTLIGKYLYQPTSLVPAAGAASTLTGDSNTCSFTFDDKFEGVSSLVVGATNSSLTITGLSGITTSTIIFKFKPLEVFETGFGYTYDSFPSSGVQSGKDTYYIGNMRKVISTLDWALYTNGKKFILASQPTDETAPSIGDEQIQPNGYIFAPNSTNEPNGNRIYDLADGNFHTVIISLTNDKKLSFIVDGKKLQSPIDPVYNASISGEFFRDGDLVFGSNSSGKSLIVSGTLGNTDGETMDTPQISQGVTDESFKFIVDNFGITSGTFDFDDMETKSDNFVNATGILGDDSLADFKASNIENFEYPDPTALVSQTSQVTPSIVTNSDFEFYKNAKKSFIKVPLPSVVTQIELEMRKLLVNG